MTISISQKISVSYNSIDILYQDHSFICDIEEKEKTFILEDVVFIQSIGSYFLDIENFYLTEKAIEYLKNNNISFNNRHVIFQMVTLSTLKSEERIYFKSKQESNSFYCYVVKLMEEKLKVLPSTKSVIIL